MTSCAHVIERLRPWAQSPLLILLASIGSSGCFEAVDCTPADNTHGCCVKKHTLDPGACDAIERMEGVAFRAVQPTKITPAPGGKVALTAAATLLLNDVDAFRSAQAEIERILEECAHHAEEEINRKRLGGKKPGKDDCDQEIGRKPNGTPMTQAMIWGLEKHKEARKCTDKALSQLIPGQFSLEQRYRFDPSTGRKSLVSREAREKLVRQGRGKELEGTLEPDVVIHSGDPLQPWAVYDFKFPCPETNLPTWSKYPKGHPYQGRTQGEMYQRALGRSPSRVTPLDGVIPDSIW